MTIFSKLGCNVPPPRWGSHADVQRAIQTNAEKIYGINPKDVMLSLPLFWGLPTLDVSGKNNHGTNQGALYKNDGFDFNGSTRIDIDSIGSFEAFIDDGPYTVNVLVKTNLLNTRQVIIGDWSSGGTNKSFAIEFGGWAVPNNVISTVMGQANANIGYLNSGVVYDAVTYYNIIVSWDGSVRKIYVQGKCRNEDVIAGMVFGTNTSIGRAGDLALLYLNGNVKFLNIFKTSIDENQAALFNDIPYGLYQQVSAPIYYSAPTIGWTGKINGITNPGKINGVSVADIASVMGQ